MEVQFKQGRGSKKSLRISDKAFCPTQKATKIYGELENGILFLLTPEWLGEWEEDDEAVKQVGPEDLCGLGRNPAQCYE